MTEKLALHYQTNSGSALFQSCPAEEGLLNQNKKANLLQDTGSGVPQRVSIMTGAQF